MFCFLVLAALAELPAASTCTGPQRFAGAIWHRRLGSKELSKTAQFYGYCIYICVYIQRASIGYSSFYR